MTNEKTFTVVGTATNKDGTVKARFANDLVTRIKILNKAGCTDINLQELPQAMTKLEALQFITAQGISNVDAHFAVANKLSEKTKIAKRGEVKMTGKSINSKITAAQLLDAVAGKSVVTAKAAVTNKADVPVKSKAEVQAMLDGAEDAPF
jgi:hypothetical protein